MTDSKDVPQCELQEKLKTLAIKLETNRLEFLEIQLEIARLDCAAGFLVSRGKVDRLDFDDLESQLLDGLFSAQSKAQDELQSLIRKGDH